MAASLISAVALWLSLDRRFLEKYHLRWAIDDWELVEYPLLLATCLFAYLFARGLIQGFSEFKPAPPVKFSPLSYLLLTGNIVITCLAVVLIMFYREYFGWNVKELGHIALAQEFMILAGLILLMASAWSLRKSDLRTVFGLKAAWICGLMGISVFLLLMEEISWGQHLFGWEAPEAFEKNIQNETNIHNFYTNRFEFAYYSAAFLCFVILPVVARRIEIREFERLRFFIPPASFGLAAIPVAGLMYENWGIFIYQLYFFVGVFLALVAAKSGEGLNRLSMIALGTVMIGSQIAFLVLGHKLMSSYEIGEMRETVIAFTLAAYSAWLLANTHTVTGRTGAVRVRPGEKFDIMADTGRTS
ncbi:hypothetical protein [Hoeflea halophila]|nr:hypothetical protein [Hoeflea halophila]